MLHVRLPETFEVKYKDKLANIPSRLPQSLFAYLILDTGTLDHSR